MLLAPHLLFWSALCPLCVHLVLSTLAAPAVLVHLVSGMCPPCVCHLSFLCPPSLRQYLVRHGCGCVALCLTLSVSDNQIFIPIFAETVWGLCRCNRNQKAGRDVFWLRLRHVSTMCPPWCAVVRSMYFRRIFEKHPSLTVVNPQCKLM